MSTRLEQALDELYGAPVEQFIERRDALAKQLKADGEKDASAAVKKQHKPTQAAHALNALSRSAKAELEALFDAGKALASGKDFKAALERQREALEAVRKKAGGPDQHAIVSVVQGALVDPKLAEEVRAGRFSKLPEVPVGFFGAAPEGAPAVVVPPPAKKSAPRAAPPPPPPSPPKRDPALKKELEAAEKEAAKAAEEVAELEQDLVEAKRRAHEATEKVARLKKRLDA